MSLIVVVKRGRLHCDSLPVDGQNWTSSRIGWNQHRKRARSGKTVTRGRAVTGAPFSFGPALIGKSTRKP